MLEYYCSVIVVLEYGVYERTLASMPTHTLASILSLSGIPYYGRMNPKQASRAKLPWRAIFLIRHNNSTLVVYYLVYYA